MTDTIFGGGECNRIFQKFGDRKKFWLHFAFRMCAAHLIKTRSGKSPKELHSIIW